MMYWNDHMSAGGWIFSILGMVILVAALIGVVLWLVSERSGRRAAGTAPPVERTTEILDRRLARGELTGEEYEQLRSALQAKPAGPPEPRSTDPAGAAT